MPIDLRQLECFVAVAEEGNLGRAALRLCITQPPLTRRIKRLERDIGADLFVRTPRGVEVTASGLALLGQARRILVLADRSLEVARAAAAGEVGRVVVGYYGSTIFDAVPRLLASFRAWRPGIDVQLERVPKHEQVDALRDGRIHVGFGRYYLPEPGMTVRHIAQEPLAVAVPEAHELATRADLRVRDLRDRPLVLFPRDRPSFADEVTQICRRAGFNGRVAAETDDVVSALGAVAVGTGVLVVPQSATNVSLPGVRFVPLSDGPMQNVSCMFAEGDHAPALASLLDFVETWDDE